MKIIKLDAIDSTNQFLKEMALSQPLSDNIVVVAKRQLKGRGQMGSTWQSSAGKNLTFSVLMAFDRLSAGDQFRISICTSLALVNLLEKYSVPDVSIKWPNDIMSGDKKVCGILIENILSSSQIKKSIIGIGLNVNQTIFEGLEYAASIKLLMHQSYDLDETLNDLLKQLEVHFKNIESQSTQTLFDAYHKYLYKINVATNFIEADGTLIRGTILGVNLSGLLRVLHDNGTEKQYNLKEIALER